ncbi:MarR family transcriptional regulator [Exiguobacterium sp. TBG-PICH-001]|uniref:MarR family winged helix-turn-helix transcriptional regulator n=1 Tax=Exiguobacterium abrahamii TaxID=2785532 RepID=UPI0018A7180E|nr:MarR family transcriptional regulator [Exiguobacterium sp. TBG-PICH-001]MBF8152837.1 MarR family transcriptional regulator [Exiguobacterium sp. TBG-PICH-001]
MSKSLSQSLNSCLFFSVKKLDRILDKIAEEAFRETGVAPTYGFILLALAETPGMSQKEIAELLHTAPSTIARFVPKLEQKGLLRIEQSGRNSFAYLTESGEQLVLQIQKAWDSLHEKFSEVLGEEEHDVMARKVSKIGDEFSSAP